jgi:hypothetical protein
VKTENELKTAGFTDSGKDRYLKSTKEYSDTLYAKSVALGDRDKADGMAREITHDHVRSAAHVIAASYGKEGNSRAALFCQIGEYIAAAGVGVGGGKLEEKWGIFMFGISLAIGTVLFVARNTNKV